VPINIQSADQQGIMPSAQILGPCPFVVTLNQVDPSSGISYPVPFTISSQVGGVWKVTAVPTRFLPVTGTLFNPFTACCCLITAFLHFLAFLDINLLYVGDGCVMFGGCSKVGTSKTTNFSSELSSYYQTDKEKIIFQLAK